MLGYKFLPITLSASGEQCAFSLFDAERFKAVRYTFDLRATSTLPPGLFRQLLRQYLELSNDVPVEPFDPTPGPTNPTLQDLFDRVEQSRKLTFTLRHLRNDRVIFEIQDRVTELTNDEPREFLIREVIEASSPRIETALKAIFDSITPHPWS